MTSNDDNFSSSSSWSNDKTNSSREFELSQKTKILGIQRIAREENTIVIEINVGEDSTPDDPFIIRSTINFNDWNTFLKTIKTNLGTTLKFELNQKQINNIISRVEAILNKNFNEIIGPLNDKSNGSSNNNKEHQQQPENSPSTAEEEEEEEEEAIPFISVNELVMKSAGAFNTKGDIVSVTPIKQAIVKIKWKCTNQKTDKYGTPLCTNPLNEVTFSPPSFRLIKLACHLCGDTLLHIRNEQVKIEYIPYVIAEVQDDNQIINKNTQKVPTIVYDENVHNVRMGENCRIYGEVKIPAASNEKPYGGNATTSSLSTVLYADSLEYLKREEEVEVTEKDVEAFARFIKKTTNPVNALGRMIAPNVIGHEDKKIALLLTLVGSISTKVRDTALKEFPNNTKNNVKANTLSFDPAVNISAIDGNGDERINVLFIGTPGTGKTTLVAEILKIMRTSRFTAAQTSSAKTLTAIAELVGDMKVIRYGPIPLAKYSPCIIDEAGNMPYEDQSMLHNVMQNGVIYFAKQGITLEIFSPASIVATSNPKGNDAEFQDSTKVSKRDMPIRHTLVDRFQIAMIFKDDNITEEEAEEYACKKLEILERKPYNYRFLKKFLAYVEILLTNNPRLHEIVFTLDAKWMIRKYYSKIKSNQQLQMSNRGLEVIIRLCKVWARAYLTNIVDATIVEKVSIFYSQMAQQYGEVIKSVIDIQDIACEAIIDVYKNTGEPLLYVEAARIACYQEETNPERKARQEEIRAYIGEDFTLRNNWALRNVLKKIRQYGNIKPVSDRPIIFQWIKQQQQHHQKDSGQPEYSQAGHHNRNDEEKDNKEGSSLC